MFQTSSNCYDRAVLLWSRPIVLATTLPNKEGSGVLGLQGSVAKILQNPVLLLNLVLTDLILIVFHIPFQVAVGIEPLVGYGNIVFTSAFLSCTLRHYVIVVHCLCPRRHCCVQHYVVVHCPEEHQSCLQCQGITSHFKF